ncbi:hypothetical protein OHA84_37580 (plasmid) [Streptomyces sp. NBC_00513]|uniref:hypothetical protein n=1 Tax=unclassified Streptomyces TaxID=2593676 RepID=UPI002258A653|nr:hypothetical protein [Streptomyces sp. NBC_00424]MCX5078837.1 hypothetical protein [Streptomyces sp. NBC_00424]WUD46243.1 hypothetical protein OHA84_37580 [Streptomyces sp. NBC_00513]
MPTPGNGISITHELGTHGWSNEETAAYEAAIEAVNGLVGTYTAVIVAEEAKAQPNREAIDAALAAQQRLAREREALRSTDHQQIAEARARYAALAREVRAGLDATRPAQGGYRPEAFENVPTATVYDIFAETASRLIGLLMARAQAASEGEQSQQWRSQALAVRAAARRVPAHDRGELLKHIAQWQSDIARLQSQ